MSAGPSSLTDRAEELALLQQKLENGLLRARSQELAVPFLEDMIGAVLRVVAGIRRVTPIDDGLADLMYNLEWLTDVFLILSETDRISPQMLFGMHGVVTLVEKIETFVLAVMCRSRFLIFSKRGADRRLSKFTEIVRRLLLSFEPSAAQPLMPFVAEYYHRSHERQTRRSIRARLLPWRY